MAVFFYATKKIQINLSILFKYDYFDENAMAQFRNVIENSDKCVFNHAIWSMYACGDLNSVESNNDNFSEREREKGGEW